MEVEARFTKKAECLEEEDSNILIAPSCSRVANSENSGDRRGREDGVIRTGTHDTELLASMLLQSVQRSPLCLAPVFVSPLELETGRESIRNYAHQPARHICPLH